MKRIEPTIATHIRLPKSLIRKLNKAAKVNQTTKAEVIRDIIKTHIQSYIEVSEWGKNLRVT